MLHQSRGGCLIDSCRGDPVCMLNADRCFLRTVRVCCVGHAQFVTIRFRQTNTVFNSFRTVGIATGVEVATADKTLDAFRTGPLPPNRCFVSVDHDSCECLAFCLPELAGQSIDSLLCGCDFFLELFDVVRMFVQRWLPL